MVRNLAGLYYSHQYSQFVSISLSRPVMWLPLILSLILALPPIMGFKTSFGQHPGLFRPSSLDECVHLATSQLARWKQVYGVCISMFLSKARHPQGPATDLANAVNGVVVNTDARYRELSDINTGVTSVYAHKRSDEEIQADDVPDHGERFQEGFFNQTDDDDNGDQKRWQQKEGGGHEAWLSVFRRAILRTRRQHSLSINSALVSLADMLMANDYNRERARQRAFRQQLLGIGR